MVARSINTCLPHGFLLGRWPFVGAALGQLLHTSRGASSSGCGIGGGLPGRGHSFTPPPHPLRRPKLVGLRHSLPTLELPFSGAVTQSAHLPWVAGSFQPLTDGSLPAVARDIAFAYGQRPKGRDTSDALNPANPCLLTSPPHANADREALSTTHLRRSLVTKSL